MAAMLANILAALRRHLRPHGDLLARLDQLGPDAEPVLLHPWDGHIIAIACPACGTWRTDPTANCPGCGL